MSLSFRALLRDEPDVKRASVRQNSTNSRFAGRTGAVLASTLTANELAGVTQHLLDIGSGKKGTPATAVQAARALTQLLRVAFQLPAEDDDPAGETTDLKAMPPAQRAAIRAALLRDAQREALDAEASEAEHIIAPDGDGG